MNNIAEEKPKYNAIGLIGGADSTAKVHKGAMKLLDDYCHEMLMKQADITNENVKFHLATFADFLGKKKKVNGKDCKQSTSLQNLGIAKTVLMDAHPGWDVWKGHDSNKQSWYPKIYPALRRKRFLILCSL